MNIFEEVHGKYGMLSTTQQRIADYIFTYPDEVCFLSLKDLSETLGVTEVTILRFVKKVGLPSFVELKRLLREHLQMRLGRDEAWIAGTERAKILEDRNASQDEMFRRYAENEQNVIKNTYSRIGPEQVLEAASLIRQARVVYAAGGELTAVLTEYLTRRLLTIGVNAVNLGSVSRALYSNYMNRVSPEDAVVIFSVPGYFKYLTNTSKFLLKRRVPQILVTDKASAPAAAYATTVLACDNHDLFYYNSLLGMMSVCGMLAYFVAMHDPEETKQRRSHLAETREEIGLNIVY